jgi:hypothetical protein
MRYLIILLFCFSAFGARYKKIMSGEQVKAIYDSEKNITFEEGSYAEMTVYTKWLLTNTPDEEQLFDPKTDPTTLAVNEEIDNLNFGKRLFAEIKVLNKVKGLTKAQRDTLKSNLGSVYSDLIDGNICDVKTAVDGITPDGTLITQNDLDTIIAKIAAFKSCT